MCVFSAPFSFFYFIFLGIYFLAVSLRKSKYYTIRIKKNLDTSVLGEDITKRFTKDKLLKCFSKKPATEAAEAAAVTSSTLSATSSFAPAAAQFPVAAAAPAPAQPQIPVAVAAPAQFPIAPAAPAPKLSPVQSYT